MMGPPADRGVNARALGDLFAGSAARTGEVRDTQQIIAWRKQTQTPNKERRTPVSGK